MKDVSLDFLVWQAHQHQRGGQSQVLGSDWVQFLEPVVSNSRQTPTLENAG